MKQIIIIVLLSSTFFSKVLGQQIENKINNKYLIALLYLKSNKEANIEIKRAFPYLVKKKEKFIEFIVREEMRFLPINFFTDKLKGKNYGIQLDQKFLDDQRLYKQQYEFPPYRNNLLNKVIAASESKIILTFSEPINNYLIVEMLDSRLNLSRKLKMGKSIQFLFIFNDEGLIEEVLNTFNHYN